MNKVLLTGRLTSDPVLTVTATARAHCEMVVGVLVYADGRETTEYVQVVAWDRLAEIAGRYLARGQKVGVDGALRTRTWSDDAGRRQWRTEVVASAIEMLSGRAPSGIRFTPDPELEAERNGERVR